MLYSPLNGNGRNMGRINREQPAGSAWARLSRNLAQLRTDLPFAVVDAMLIAASYLAALGIRSFDGELPDVWWTRVVQFLPVVVAIHLSMNVVMGAYGHVWEYASVGEARRVIGATFWATTIMLVGMLASGVRPVPLSVLVVGSFLSLASLGAVRFRSRLFSFHRTLDLSARDRAVIIGTGKRAAEVARNTLTASYPVQVIGFVSPSISTGPRRIAGLPTLGNLEDIANIVVEYDIQQVIVAAQGASSLARTLVDLCVDVDVRLSIAPDLHELLGSNESGPDIRDLILDDLLLRPTVTTDLAAVEAVIRGKSVLVTGAGGSIGTEIVNQALAFFPDKLIALDHDETHLHDNLLKWNAPPGTSVIPALGDIRDREYLRRLIALYQPEVVFHAAAHKHVPILEEWPDEAVKTNVLGTANLIDALRNTGLERFVLVSTDKAAKPNGVMGATKRLAEMQLQAAAERWDGDAGFASVRFGNVLGSRGSVVPTFVEQIRAGGPVTITDERMTRYFMTTSEAVQLVLQSAALATEGETFVLDMGQPVRIIDLAHRMIRLAGLVPGRDIEVKVTGARRGENLYEKLADGELQDSPHPKIKIAEKASLGVVALHDTVDSLRRMAYEEDSAAQLRQYLFDVAVASWNSDESIDLRTKEDVKQWT